MRTLGQPLTLSLSLVCLVACPTTPYLGPSSTTLSSESDDGNDDVDTNDTSDTSDTTGEFDFQSVSILLVVDNSGSMGEEQAQLTSGITALTDTLDAANLDWRIGVTTSDNGNPWCPAGTTTPEAGQLVMQSCRQRLNDFLFSDTVDVQDVACLDVCSLSEIDLQPSTTASDPSPALRPWLERTGGVTNVADPYQDVLRCMLPQGVNGCGFESQLESSYRSVARATDSNDEAHGFFEAGRLPVIVFLTDEADCSAQSEWSDIFAQDGSKVFWTDPSAAFPTSAVCWNAGVTCTGNPSGYDSCEPANKDINGNVGATDADAVLRSISEYNDRFGLMGAIVFGIVGVDSNGEPAYADVSNTDPGFQDSFGIGPGCVGPGGATAVPPVRIRAVAEANAPAGERKLYSVCASDYGATFANIGQTIVAEF